MSIPSDPGSGRPDFQPAAPPQAPATPPFVGAQPVPPVDAQPPPAAARDVSGAIPERFVAAPKRPSSATAASVLAIVGGCLWLLFGLLMLFRSRAAFTSTVLSPTSQAGVVVMLSSFTILAAAIMVLVAGITHLKGRGHVVLTIGVVLQLLLLVLFILVSVRFSGQSFPPVLIPLAIGMGLAIVTLIMTYTSSARAWRRNRRGQGAPPPHGVVL